MPGAPRSASNVTGPQSLPRCSARPDSSPLCGWRCSLEMAPKATMSRPVERRTSRKAKGNEMGKDQGKEKGTTPGSMPAKKPLARNNWVVACSDGANQEGDGHDAHCARARSTSPSREAVPVALVARAWRRASVPRQSARRGAARALRRLDELRRWRAQCLVDGQGLDRLSAWERRQSADAGTRSRCREVAGGAASAGADRQAASRRGRRGAAASVAFSPRRWRPDSAVFWSSAPAESTGADCAAAVGRRLQRLQRRSAARRPPWRRLPGNVDGDRFRLSPWAPGRTGGNVTRTGAGLGEGDLEPART